MLFFSSIKQVVLECAILFSHEEHALRALSAIKMLDCMCTVHRPSTCSKGQVKKKRKYSKVLIPRR